MDYLAVVQMTLFVAWGVISWRLSYTRPMPEYQTKPVENFDRWFMVLAIVLITLHTDYLAPWVGEQILAAWPKLATKIVWFHAKVATQYVAVRWLEFVFFADFLGYFAHRFMHSSLAWRFHSIHHSPESLNWLAGVRGSPIHYIVILTPTLLADYLFMYGLGFWPLFFFMLFDMLNQQFSHSNVKLPRVKQLEYLFVTPRMHFIHHHPCVKYTNTNYGLYFSIWDRLFGTYVDAETVTPKGLLGLDYKESLWSSFWGLDKRARNSNHSPD